VVATRILVGVVCLFGSVFIPFTGEVPTLPPAKQGVGIHPTRRLLYPSDVGQLKAPLAPFVEKLLSPSEKKVILPPPHPADIRVFLRVVSKRHILDGEALRDNAWLGVRPFVFLTVPETAYGKTLAELFSAIGYSADEVLSHQVGEEKVALVFTYPEGIPPQPHRHGELPDEWERKVYVPTWDILFALTEKLIVENQFEVDPSGKGFFPTKLLLRDQREKLFVLGYPEAGKQRIKKVDYDSLRIGGGADWEYRAILERSMSAASHFRGNGFTQPTFGPRPLPQQGYPEFLGPNAPLRELAALAVIYLGRLRLTE
jgi:hypothetical protein